METNKKIVFSLIIALLSFIGILGYIKQRESELLMLSEPQRVLVAKQDILAFTQLDETMIDKVEVPLKFFQPDAIQNYRDVIGQVASVPIREGEQILGTKLLRYGTETGLSMKIAAGYRAISIAVDEVAGVGKLVKPDDFVDLLVTFDFGDKTQSRKYTYTLFENIQVLAVKKNLGIGGSAFNNSNKDSKLPQLASGSFGEDKSSTYTLAVTPEEAQQLVLAQESGKITVALRSLWETKNKLKLSPVTPADLTGLKALIKQQKRPAYMEYRGGR